MARDFDGTDDKLGVEVAAVTAMPFTMACWFNADIATAALVLMAITDSDVNSHHWFLEARGSVAGDPVGALARDGGVAAGADTTTGFTVGQWHHAAGVFASSSDFRAFIDGGSKGTANPARSPLNVSRTEVGTLTRLSAGTLFMNGRIAEAAVWNVALTDAEVAIIARPGFPLNRYRPSNIVGYWRIGVASPEPDWSGNGNNMTVTGAVIANHPPIAPPFGFDYGWQGAFTAGAPPPAAEFVGPQMLLMGAGR